MPREIDCPDCGGSGRDRICNEIIVICKKCDNGKITVYTQEELDNAVREGMKSNNSHVRRRWLKGVKSMAFIVGTLCVCRICTCGEKIKNLQCVVI